MTKTEKLQAIAAATNGNVYDAEYNGGEWMMNAVETAETFEQFVESSSRWNERSTMKRGTIGGCPFIVWKLVQMRKGDTRRSLAVIDLGEIRVAIDAELGDFVE